jgi:hypothetical protein
MTWPLAAITLFPASRNSSAISAPDAMKSASAPAQPVRT